MEMEFLEGIGATCINDRQKIKFIGTSGHNNNTWSKPIIAINKCTPNKLQNCKTDQEIKDFVNNKKFEVVILSRSYNTTNYNPE